MERLERIKKETEFNHFNYPDTGKFALAFNLKQDDFDWLIKQAEKTERYEKALEHIATRKMSTYLSTSHMNQDFIKTALEALMK